MYLNQKALWHMVVVPAVLNQYGDITTSPEPQTIAVRRQEHVEEVRTKDGATHNTNYIYYTHDDVNVDDTLDGNLVIRIYDMRTLGGKKRLRRCITI